MSTREQIESVLFRSGADRYDVAVEMLASLVDRLRAEAAAEALEALVAWTWMLDAGYLAGTALTISEQAQDRADKIRAALDGKS